MPRLHHVNLGVGPEQVDDEIAFLTDVLGYRRLDVTNDGGILRRWYEADDGSQIHLSEDDDHRPAAKAHVALEYCDLDEVAQRLIDRSWAFRDAGEFEGIRLLLCRDPAGNRFELRSVGSG